MESSIKTVSYKKVLVFGATETGKSTLTEFIKSRVFKEEIHSENGNLAFNIKHFLNRFCV